MSLPRMTPASRNLTRKNPKPLKIIELPEKPENMRDQSGMTMDVGTIYEYENSSESELDIVTEDSQFSRSTRASSLRFYTNESFKFVKSLFPIDSSR